MNVLLLDAGNTRVKWAVVDTDEPGKLQFPGVCAHSAAGFSPQLRQGWVGLPRIDKVLIGCVAGDDIVAELDKVIIDQWGLSAEVLKSQESYAGIVNGYTKPEQLGVDRWLAMLGGWRLLEEPVPLWIVDCGTAVTIDYLDCDGNHRGGLILPGLAMMRDGLTLSAAALKTPGHEDPLLLDSIGGLARDTNTALSVGTTTTLVASLDRIVSDFALGDQAVRVITGGDASIIGPCLAGDWLLQPNLVLEGMAVYAEETG